MSIRDLSKEDRLRLVRFVCSFAWADLEVQDAERGFVQRLFEQLELDESEQAQAQQWLKLPPPPEDVDPTDIPQEHRDLFLVQVTQMMTADGVVDPNEMETLTLFEQLLRPQAED